MTTLSTRRKRRCAVGSVVVNVGLMFVSLPLLRIWNKWEDAVIAFFVLNMVALPVLLSSKLLDRLNKALLLPPLDECWRCCCCCWDSSKERLTQTSWGCSFLSVMMGLYSRECVAVASREDLSMTVWSSSRNAHKRRNTGEGNQARERCQKRKKNLVFMWEE